MFAGVLMSVRDKGAAQFTGLDKGAVESAVGGGGPTYTLTAAQGTFSLTGQAVALKAARKLTAN